MIAQRTVDKLMSANSQMLPTLPNFRNVGVIFRILVLAALAKYTVLFAYATDGFEALVRVGEVALLFEITLLITVLILYMLARWLITLSYRNGVTAVICVVAFVAGGLDWATQTAFVDIPTSGVLKASLISAVLGLMILGYFDWRQRILSPALAESRLMALQARIRPHFLFNSINTAISVVRDDPKRAEEVLLDMSELFRVVLAEPRALVSLGDELRVARAYLDIEQVRLGERLQVRWECEGAPLGAQVPVLLLQPLVENAVWHGIEPAPEGGEITVRISCRNKILQIEVSNPVVVTARSRPGGNRIALDNIAERLALHFDAEAQLRVIEKEGHFRVRVRLPLTFERQRNGARR